MRHISRTELGTIIDNILGERLPNCGPQALFTESLTPKYKIGSRLVSPGGLVWHYARGGATGITATYRRRGAASTIPGLSVTNFVTIGITPIGGTTVVINDTAAVGVHPADYWANGEADIFPTAPDYSNDQSRIVKSSTPSNGVSVTLTLYQPVYYAIPNAADVYMCPSPYMSVDEAVSVPTGDCSIVGFSWMPVTPLYYFWCQTWGLCQPVGTGGDMGIAAGSREIVFNYGDGTIRSAVAGGAYGTHQRAGYLVPRTILAGGGDEAYIMLQLDP